MSKSVISGIRLGTFDGKAGSKDWQGVLCLAESKNEVVITNRWTEDTGEKMVEITITANLPANEIRMTFELPQYAAEKLLDAYPTEQ